MIDAMERCRRRLAILLDERTPAGKIRQKTFADYMGKSEAWLTNVLSGKRGLRIIDLDRVADFFRLPVSEFVREADAELVEVTPTEKKLLRKLRRAPEGFRDSVLTLAALAPTVSTNVTSLTKKRIRKQGHHAKPQAEEGKIDEKPRAEDSRIDDEQRAEEGKIDEEPRAKDTIDEEPRAEDGKADEESRADDKIGE